MGEAAHTAPRRRDPIFEQREREAFLVLLHAVNITGSSITAELTSDRVARDLAFPMDGLSRLIDLLVSVGFMRCPAAGRLILTAQGIDYIERLAKNRRSVRCPQRFSGTIQ